MEQQPGQVPGSHFKVHAPGDSFMFSHPVSGITHTPVSYTHLEIVSGHRRQKASELAGYADMPCIVRNLTDDEAITQMVEDNLNQREEILPSERAKACLLYTSRCV